MSQDNERLLTLVLCVAALAVACWVNGYHLGHREGLEHAECPPCEVTCGVTFKGDHWEVRRGNQP